MKNKLMFIAMSLFLSLGLASATIGNYKQGQIINLPQTCADCTFNNITSITAPDGAFLVGNVQMTKNGNVYNYTLNSSLATSIGTYTVSGIGDPSGINEVWVYHFDVGGGNLAFIIFAFALFFGLMIYGVKIQNPWVSLIGCMGISILGVYSSFNGVGSYKNDLTNAISYVTIAIGLGIGFQAARDITNL